MLCLLLCALVLAGYSLVQIWLRPPQKQKEPEAAQLPADPHLLADLVARTQSTALTPGVLGLGNASQLCTDTAVAEYLRISKYRLPATAKLPANPPLWGDLLLRTPGTALPPGVPGLGTFAQLYSNTRVATWLMARKYQLPPPLARHTEPVLGDDDSFKLKVKLTSQGAGVISVILNQFKAADPDGKPVKDKPLELVPEELNRGDPSNLLFHYDKPDDDRPLDTLGNIEWTMKSLHNGVGTDKHDEVVFVADVPGQNVRITKTFTLRPTDYHVGLKVEIQRKEESQEPLKFRYQVTSAHHLPIEGQWYTGTFRNALVGRLGKDLKDLRRDFQDSRTIAFKAGGDDVVKGDYERIQYAAIAVQYFASVIAVTDRIVPADAQERPTDPNFLARARATVESEPDKDKPWLDDIVMRVITEPVAVGPRSPVVHKYLLYYGPVKVRLLGGIASGQEAVSAQLIDRYADTLHLDTLTDYRMQGVGPGPWISENIFSYIGWTFLLIKITNFMHWLLGELHSFLHLPYGLCIILLTVLVRGLMHPISRKQARTSIKMQALMPELKKLQEKHKDDRQALAMAQMELWRKHGVHPMGSCWIVFLQMPIFMGLYYALQESIHFRFAEFLWIKNLAAPDMLFWWTDKIPLISRPQDQATGFFSFLYLGPYFNLLPVIAVTFMILQQKFLMPPPTDEQQEMTQKMMKYMMIFMGLMFYKVAAGMCIYFIVSSVWGLAERKLLPKAKPAMAAGATTAGTGAPPAKPPATRAKTKTAKKSQTNGAFKKVQDMWAELLKQAKKK